MVKGVKTQDIITSDNNPFLVVLSDETYKLFKDSFKSALREYLNNPELPETLDFVFRHVTNDKHARYLRHFEIATTFLCDISESESIRYEIVFELYSDEDDQEKCDTLSFYTAEYNKSKNN